MEFICERPVLVAEIPLTPAEVGERVDLNTATIWGLNSGLRDVFAASDGAVAGIEDVARRHRIRKALTAEYYQLAGFKSATIKRAKHDHNNRDAQNIISNCPSLKTSNLETLNLAARYVFQNFATIKGYYTFRLKKLKYHGYRNKQKALSELCKRVFTGSQKYGQEDWVIPESPFKWKPFTPVDHRDEANAPIIVAFGEAQFGVLRGNVPPPTKKFKEALKNYVKATNRADTPVNKFVVMIDEYYTSQVCPLCPTRTTENERDARNNRIHPVLKCNTCDTIWP